MAITEERLKELIKQEAMVYQHLRRWEYYNERVEAVKLSKTYYIDFDCGSLELCSRTGEHLSRLDDLYEHKADAEWELEFGNVEKRIKFVKPKPFRDIKKSMITLYSAHGFAMYLDSMDNYVRVYDERIDFYERDLIFQKPFNEENYTEACRLIKKLFMGEE